YLHTDLKQIINENIVVIDAKNVTSAEVRDIALEKTSKKILYIDDNRISLVMISQQTKQLNYVECGEISIDASITEVVQTLEKNQHLVVKNKKGSMIGYLCLPMLTNH